MREKRESLEQQEHPPPPTPTISKEVTGVHPMGQRELAKRLGLKSHSTLSYQKHKPTFPQWSQARDKDGIARRFEPRSQLFYPVG